MDRMWLGLTDKIETRLLRGRPVESDMISDGGGNDDLGASTDDETFSEVISCWSSHPQKHRLCLATEMSVYRWRRLLGHCTMFEYVYGIAIFVETYC